MQRSTRDWEANARDPAWLSHRAGRLEDAERLSGRPDLWARLDAAPIAYLGECRRMENAAREERERQLLALADSERARRRWATVSGGLAAILAIVATLVGIYRVRQANEKTQLLAETAQAALASEANARLAVAEATRNEAQALAAAENARLAAAEAMRNEARALAEVEAATEAREAMLAALEEFEARGHAVGIPSPPQRALRIFAPLFADMRHNLVMNPDKGGNVFRGEVSPDGRHVVTPSLAYIQVLDDETGKFVTTTLGTLQLWDVTTEQLVREFFSPPGNIGSVAFSPDGRLVAMVPQNGVAQIWDVETGTPFGEPISDGYPILFIRFSPNGRLLVTVSSNTMRLWDVESGESVGPTMHHASRINSVAFSPDGTVLATGSDDKTAQIWDTATGEPIRATMRHEGKVALVAFSPDSRLLATGSDGKTVRIWDVMSGRPIGAEMFHEREVVAIAFSPDGSLLATLSDDGAARLWNFETGELLEVGDAP